VRLRGRHKSHAKTPAASAAVAVVVVVVVSRVMQRGELRRRQRVAYWAAVPWRASAVALARSLFSDVPVDAPDMPAMPLSIERG
jgi:hypothetical protein